MLESKARLDALIAAANAKTGGNAVDLTAAVQVLMDGYGNGGGGDDIAAILERTITEYSDTKLTKVGNGAFMGCSKLTSVSLPSVENVGDNAFESCSQLTSVRLPSVTRLGREAFYGCSRLVEIDLPNATYMNAGVFQSCIALINVNIPLIPDLWSSAFMGCKKLQKIVLASVKDINYGAFQNCAALDTLIISNAIMCKMSATNCLTGTPIAKGTGYIYVPRSLLDSYKGGTNWTVYADQIRAIEDYPEICGG